MAHPSSIAARSSRLTLLGIALMVGGCCGAERERAGEILDAVQSGKLSFGSNASVMNVYRESVEDLPEAQELVSLGDCAAEVAAERIVRGASAVSDSTAALCAFTIERTGYVEGIDALRAFLLSQPGLEGHVWSAHFAVRALLVLRGLPDPTGGYELYGDEAVGKALDGP
jgi:hypothetical protein